MSNFVAPSHTQDPYILVVDDEPDIRHLVSEILADEGYQVAVAENAARARQLYAQRTPDLALLDIWMPDSDGISLLKEWVQEQHRRFPVIMMSGHGTVETAVEATRLGAYDFLEKPLSMAKLLLTVERALANARLQQENNGLKRRLDSVVEPIGRSAVMEQLRQQIKRLAQHDTSVLLVGESGSGKATFARYLHAQSSRRDRPFVDVSLGAIAPDNIVLELFGKAANGVVQPGLLAQAHGGVLFLDKVADMDADTQLRLAGALESHAFTPSGASQPTQVDVRVIAATRKPLEAEVQSGRFRKDLFYLLNAVTLVIPPLRQHAEDIPDLLNFYTDYFVTREKLPFRHFSVAVQNFLRNHPWHGNIRELKNLVQRLLILGSGAEVELEEVKAVLSEAQTPGQDSNLDLFNLPLKDAREQFEKAYLEYHLDKNGGSIARLSQAIGIERTHLYRKLHALDIKFRDK